MITGEIKNRIDQIWDTFLTEGITNPLNILEQMAYLPLYMDLCSNLLPE